MKKEYLIFVPESGIDEDLVGYSGVIEWCYKNLSHPNVMSLTLDDVYYLEYKSEILNIINEENDSMLREGENDWIIPTEVKLRIKRRLLTYEQQIKNNREKEIVTYLIKLLELSIKTGKSLYFTF
jgi:hypothetical protein